MKVIVRHPRLITGLIAAITVFFAIQLPRAELDNNTFRFVPENAEARLAVKRVEEQFGSQISILIGLKRKYGTVLDADFLFKLRDFVNAAEDLNLVESVTSVMNVDYISGNSDSIIVEPLVSETFAGTREEIAELKSRLADWELFTDSLISRDGKATQILVNLATESGDGGDADSVRVYDDLRTLALATGFPDTEVFVTGMPAYTSVMNHAMRADLVVLIPLVVILVLGILYLSFRNLGGVVLPMLTVIVSTVWSVGLMVLLGVKLSMLATVLPVILIGVGSAYGIHIVSHYYDEMRTKERLSKDEHNELILRVVNRIAKPVLLAALTTFAGFVSLAFTPVVPIQEFGIFASVGVMVAFAVAVLLIPSLLVIKGPALDKAVKTSGGSPDAGGIGDPGGIRDAFSEKLTTSFLGIVSHRYLVVFAVLALICVGTAGVSILKIDNVIIEYFKADTEIARSDRFIREDFAGSKSLSIVVRGKNPGDLSDPDILTAMDDLSIYLENEVPEVGKVTGYHQFIKRINQVFNSTEDPRGLTSPVTGEADESSFGDWSAFGDESTFGDWGDTGDDPVVVAAGESMREKAGFDEQTGFSATTSESITRLAAVELLSRALADTRGRDKSVAALVNSLERAVNYRGAAYYEIPSDPERYGKDDKESLKNLIGNYLVLLSGDLSAWADNGLEPTEARINVQLRTIGYKDTAVAVEAIREYVKHRFPEGYDVEIAGTAMVEQALNELVVSSQLVSIISSLVLVFIILSVFYRSAIAGLIGIFTLGLVILTNFAIMGFLGIKLNVGTALVGSICVGTGIDYIIHFLAGYRHEMLEASDSDRAMRRTFLTSGKAILFNAFSVAAGFIVLAFSSFNMLAYLGILVAAAMLVSSIISLTVLPVLINILNPKFLRKV